MRTSALMTAWPTLKYHPIYIASSAAAAFTSWKADAINTLWVLWTSSVITVYWMENTFSTKSIVFHARLVIIMNSRHAANIISMQLIFALCDLRFRHHTHEAWLCPQEENNNAKEYSRILWHMPLKVCTDSDTDQRSYQGQQRQRCNNRRIYFLSIR